MHVGEVLAALDSAGALLDRMGHACQMDCEGEERKRLFARARILSQLHNDLVDQATSLDEVVVITVEKGG